MILLQYHHTIIPAAGLEHAMSFSESFVHLHVHKKLSQKNTQQQRKSPVSSAWPRLVDFIEHAAPKFSNKQTFPRVFTTTTVYDSPCTGIRHQASGTRHQKPPAKSATRGKGPTAFGNTSGSSSMITSRNRKCVHSTAQFKTRNMPRLAKFMNKTPHRDRANPHSMAVCLLHVCCTSIELTSVTFRRPKAMVYRWKELSSNGNASASA